MKSNVPILIVEDEGVVAMDIQKRLKKSGYTIPCLASSGEEAIQKVEETHPALVLMDIYLKGKIDGIEAAQQIRDRFDIPVVYLTAYSEKSTFERAKVTEPFGYLLKPVEEIELKITIEMALYKHKINKKIRENEQWLSTTLKSIGDAVITTDKREVITFINPVAERLTGWNKEDALGKDVTEVFHAVDRNTRRRTESPALHLIRKGRLAILSDHTRLVRKNGSEIPIEDNVSLLRDENGKVNGIVIVFRDITERNQAEEALEISKANFTSIVEKNADGILIVDEAGIVRFANPAAENFLKQKGKKLIGQSFNYPLERNKPVEIDIIRRNGEPGTAEMRVDQTDWQDETAYLISLHDMTKRQQAEKALRESEEYLRQSQKMEAIGKLAGGIAHDFNNILTVISGYSELLLDRLAAGDSSRKDVEEIKKAGERAATLTRQLLAFSRKQVLAPEILVLNDVVTNMDKMLRRLIGEDIDFVINPDPELGRVKADPGQIEQVIMNLAVNARDAMPNGGKLTIVTANVDLDEAYASRHIVVQPGPYILLAVSDTGLGMNKKIQSQMFDPFFTTKETGKGTGLGLSTVYGIVKQSGGNIWVYSEPGYGTTFKIYLPRTNEPIKRKETARVSAKATLDSETILLVEDEKGVRELSGEILQSKGYTVLEAADPQESLKLLKKHNGSIDLLLTDVVMPGMSGRSLALNLSALSPKTKVLYMSGYTDDAIIHHGVLEKGTHFLQKPFTPEALANKVREVLDERT